MVGHESRKVLSEFHTCCGEKDIFRPLPSMVDLIALFKHPTKLRILVAPLDWGLGHATRCVPLIKAALQAGHEVVLAADRSPLALLQKEFPGLELIRLKGYEISYPSNGSMIFSMALQLPKLGSRVIEENFRIRSIVKSHNIDWVISDNRYGLFGHAEKSIFITHQLHIKTGFLETIFNAINRWFIQRFDECWVPDWESEPSLAGELSHPTSALNKLRYLGPLSRFSKLERTNESYNLTILISGPEPQRSMFENKVVQQLDSSFGRVALIRGLPLEDSSLVLPENVRCYNHLPDKELNQILVDSDLILSRPGYSTVMDLVTLKKKAIFVPTPGQTEQEYLAQGFHDKKIAPFQTQDQFNLKALQNSVNHYQGF